MTYVLILCVLYGFLNMLLIVVPFHSYDTILNNLSYHITILYLFITE